MGTYYSVQGVIKLKPSVVKKVRRLKRQIKRNSDFDLNHEYFVAKMFGFKYSKFRDFCELDRSGHFFYFDLYKNYLILNVDIKQGYEEIEFYMKHIAPKLGRQFKFFTRSEDDYNDNDDIYDYTPRYTVHGKLENIPFVISTHLGKYKTIKLTYGVGETQLQQHHFEI